MYTLIKTISNEWNVHKQNLDVKEIPTFWHPFFQHFSHTHYCVIGSSRIGCFLIKSYTKDFYTSSLKGSTNLQYLQCMYVICQLSKLGLEYPKLQTFCEFLWNDHVCKYFGRKIFCFHMLLYMYRIMMSYKKYRTFRDTHVSTNDLALGLNSDALKCKSWWSKRYIERLLCLLNFNYLLKLVYWILSYWIHF